MWSTSMERTRNAHESTRARPSPTICEADPQAARPASPADPLHVLSDDEAQDNLPMARDRTGGRRPERCGSGGAAIRVGAAVHVRVSFRGPRAVHARSCAVQRHRPPPDVRAHDLHPREVGAEGDRVIRAREARPRRDETHSGHGPVSGSRLLASLRQRGACSQRAEALSVAQLSGDYRSPLSGDRHGRVRSSARKPAGPGAAGVGIGADRTTSGSGRPPSVDRCPLNSFPSSRWARPACLRRGVRPSRRAGSATGWVHYLWAPRAELMNGQ
jgi:hypothetical protein